MRWLIVEDALRDRQGHWLEWVTTFYQGFRRMGDEVTVLADAAVQPDIRDSVAAVPILPASIWHRRSDGSGWATRYSRVFIHAWQTWGVMRHYFETNPSADAIFVPTMSLHHLLAWAWLIKTTLRNRPTRVLLFFLTLPVRWDPQLGRPVWDGSPTAKLFFRLLGWIIPEVESGKVVLGAETERTRAALEFLSGAPTTCFPQPATPLPPHDSPPSQTGEVIEMACYGAARSEKGSDVLQEAVALHRRRFPLSRSRFTIQWIEDFVTDGGRQVVKSPELLRDPKVQYITHYFANGEYPQRLKRTHVMLLPYRLSSYGLRGSRVVIEAVINGIPAIATRGTTLADVVESFGAGLLCDDGDPESLALAICEAETRCDELKRRAENRKRSAANEFSIEAFRRIFVNTGADARPLRCEALT